MIKSLREYLSKTWLWCYLRLKYYSFEIKDNIKSQILSETDFCNEAADLSEKKILIPMIETSHYQFYQILVIAKALIFRGAKVKVLICNSELKGCEIKSAKSRTLDPCLNCRFNAKNILPLYDIEVVTLTNYLEEHDLQKIKNETNLVLKKMPKAYKYKSIEIMSTVRDSVVRYFYGNVPNSPHNKELKRVYFDHINSFLLGLTVADKIFSSWDPDIILGNMEVYSAWAPYFKLAKKQKRQTSLISISPFDYNSIVFNQTDLYESPKRYTKYLNSRTNLQLDQSEKSELRKFINTRFAGEAATFRDLGSFDEKSNGINTLKINTSKRNIFLFSNIYWDVGMSELNTIFDNVIDWVIESINIVKENSEIHLYIKPHPAEIYDSSSSMKGVSDFINEAFPTLPSNISLIHPELKIKTYDLFPYIDLGVLYNGTLGLEMMLKNIPSVVAGIAPYSTLKSVNQPLDINQYKNILLGNTEISKPDFQEVELFSYFYFIKTLLPFNLTKSAYAHNFKGYSFDTLDKLLPDNDPNLDHLCECILNFDNKVIEDW